MARLESINVSQGGVPKVPIPEAAVTREGVSGDRQRDLRFHGGPDRAVSLYSAERIDLLRAEGHPIEAGSAGENLTVSGLDWETVGLGSRLRVGEVELEVTGYASPCATIRASFVDGDSRRIAQKLHPGWSRLYARVLKEGRLKTGDVVAVGLPTPVRLSNRG